MKQKMRRKFLAAAVTLGLAMGTAFGAYAKEVVHSGGEVSVSTWVDGKEQGPVRTVFKDGSVVWAFSSDNRAVGCMVAYGGDGPDAVWLSSGGELNGLGIGILKNGTQKANFYEDDEIKQSVRLKSWTTANKIRFYAREESDIDDGKAIAVFPSGDIYVGDFKDGMRSGWGTYFYSSDKTWYMGEWKDGLMDGVGYMTFPDSSLYLYKSAVWTKGKCQNVVFYYTEKDEVFLAANKDNIAQGPAAIIKADGTITLREYKDNKISNAEPKIYADKYGNQYIGTDGKSGLGLKVTKRGDIQIGSFKNGELDGQGFVYWGDRMRRDEGTFKQGSCTEGVSIWANGSYFKGTYKDYLRSQYDQGIFRCFTYSKEGEFNKYNELETGIYKIFQKDGSATKKVYLYGEEKK